MDTLPADWRWLATADRNRPLPAEVPFEVTNAVGYKSYDAPLRRASSAAAVFWAARVPPNFALLPGVIRLVCYHSVRDAELPAMLAAAAARPWLQDLTVMGSRVATLPPELAGMGQLRRLSFEDNAITEVPAHVAGLGLLHTLDLEANPLERVDPALATMPALRELRIRGTSTTPMPLRELPVLPQVRKLAIGWAPALATRLGEYRSLTTLAVHGEVGPGVPAELGDLGDLRALALAYSPWAAVPAVVRALRKLETLYLPYGAYAGLPDWLPELAELRFLAVFGCHTMTPSHIVDTVARLPNLGRLFLPFPFPPPERQRLKKLGFRSLTGNPCIVCRAGFEDFEDPFAEIR